MITTKTCLHFITLINLTKKSTNLMHNMVSETQTDKKSTRSHQTVHAHHVHVIKINGLSQFTGTSQVLPTLSPTELMQMDAPISPFLHQIIIGLNILVYHQTELYVTSQIKVVCSLLIQFNIVLLIHLITLPLLLDVPVTLHKISPSHWIVHQVSLLLPLSSTESSYNNS